MKSNTFCPKAWTEVAISPSGLATPCCIYQDPVKNESGEYLNMAKNDFTEIWNCNGMTEIRKKMLSGEKLDGCEQCYFQEKNGNQSMRQQSILLMDDLKIQDLIELTNQDGSLDSPISSIDLKLGNKCNLACRMCQPKDSSFVMSEFDKMSKEDPHFRFYQNTSPFDPHLKQNYDLVGNWSSDLSFLEKFEKICTSLTALSIAGGEPLMQDEFYKIIEVMNRSKTAKNCRLFISTNLSHLPDNLIEQLQEFKQLHIGVSVEAYGKKLQYIRYPLEWKKFEENIIKLSKMVKSIKSFQIALMVTTQAYNILNLHELLYFYQDKVVNLFKKHEHCILLNLLTYPEHLSITILPETIKLKAISRLENSLYEINDKSFFKIEETRDAIRKIIGILKSPEIKPNPSICKTLLNYSFALDLKRDQSLEATMPVFYNELTTFINSTKPKEHVNLKSVKSMALAYLAQKNIKEAKELLVLLVDEYQDSDSARQLADLYIEQKDIEKGIIYYKKSISLNSNDIQSIRSLTWIYHKTNNFEKASKLFLQILESETGDKDALNFIDSIAWDNLEKRHIPKAIKYLEIFAARTSSSMAIKCIANQYKKIGELTKAIFFFEKYLKLNPTDKENEDTIKKIAWIYQEIGNTDDAFNIFSKILERNYNDKDANEFMRSTGWFFYQKENFLEAIRFFEKTAININDIEVFRVLGEINNNLGNIKNSINYYYKSLDLNRNNLQLIKTLLWITFSDNQIQKSKELVTMLILQSPSDPDILLFIKSLLDEKGLLYKDQANIQFAHRCFELTKNLDILLTIYWLYRKTNNEELALQVGSNILNMDTDKSEVIKFIEVTGWAHLENSRLNKAIEYFEIYLNKKTDINVLKAIGWECKKHKRFSLAKTYFLRVLELDPNEIDSLDELRRLNKGILGKIIDLFKR